MFFTDSTKILSPSWSEFQDFNTYIHEMELCGVFSDGIVKIIPPSEWIPRKENYYNDDIMNIKIPTITQQIVRGDQGCYRLENRSKKPKTVAEFKAIAESDEYRTPSYYDFSDINGKYWRNILSNPPFYGPNVSGSLMDEDLDVWNFNNLNSILDHVYEDYNVQIQGVNTPNLHFGMWKSCVPWHTEHMDLYNINYLHKGKPKTWFAIPPSHGRKFESVAASYFQLDASKCKAFLRHKNSILSPPILHKYSIPMDRITQEEGEIIVNFPYSYHASFDHGFNIAESINFALPRWINYGKHTSLCHCQQSTVKICMNTFVKRYQPDKYRLWLQGKVISKHPEDYPK